LTRVTIDDMRKRAEEDLLYFIKLVAPYRLLGSIHEDVISWWTRQEALHHQLLLLPRAHQKSMLIAYRAAWEITRNPAVTILYISATRNLAEKQLRVVKDILTSKIYARYWPTMVLPEEGKREKWTETEICVDHPVRKREGIRDSTVFTAGLTTGITGLHCDIAILDDVVVKENAYTEEGRSKVNSQYSLLSSIENPDALEWVVGTRYHPKDLYGSLIDMKEELFDANGDPTGASPVFEIMQHQVEDRGDGTGEFLWPRQLRSDGKWFGFNTQVLMKKKAQYLDKAQYRAQYYNDPNDPDSAAISADKFQYYDRKFLKQEDGYWWINDRRLNVFAGIDFAFSLRKTADWTAIAVIGIDYQNNIYVLDVERFRSERIADYYAAIMRTYRKWEYKVLRAETTVAQKTIVRELKDSYIRPNGLMLKIDEYSPTRNEGTKAERIRSTLEPKYDNNAMWHYRGGNCQILEEELVLGNPPHDDVKDALTSAIDIAIAPKFNAFRERKNKIIYNTRFGGLS
jgi:phage terminase large subunit-like protein